MKLKNWSKELVMTFIGTTLSIVLTFGTAHVIDAKQKRADGRQAAIMVIRDMEYTCALFRSYKESEEEFFNATQYIDEHFGSLESLSRDTAGCFFQSVTTSSTAIYHYDDANEKIFQSSPDSWKSIDNPNFIDAVEEFYHSRRGIFERLNNDPIFARPVPYQEWYELLFSNELYSDAVDAQFIRKYLRSKDVKRYVEYSVVRRHYLNEYADYYANLANRCKFILGITDDEITAYEMQKKRLGKPLKRKKLIGTWREETNPEKQIIRSFEANQIYENHTVKYIPYSLYTGKVEYKSTTNGIWEIYGDSLIIYIAPSFEYELDRTHISYAPDKEEAVNKLLQEWDESIQASQQKKLDAGYQRHAYFASIDPSGDKVELRWTDENGAEVIWYMTRVKETEK